MKADLSRKGVTVWGRRVLIAILWIAVWEAVYLIINRDVYFPSPINVVLSLGSLAVQKSTWLVIGWSVYRTLLALLFAVILGVVLGMACGLNRTMYDLINPLIVIFKSTPVVSVIIIAIIWFHATDVPIFSGFLMCFPIVFTGAVTGIRNTDPKLVEMCSFYKVRRFDMLKSLYFRSSVPYINSSVVSAIGICWKAVAAAEVLSMPRNSIGANLFFAKTELDPALLFAWTFVIILLSYCFETIYSKVSGYDKT